MAIGAYKPYPRFTSGGGKHKMPSYFSVRSVPQSSTPPGKPTLINGHPGNAKIFVNGLPSNSGGAATSWIARAYPQPSGPVVALESSPNLNPDGTVTALVDLLTNGGTYNVTLAGKNAFGEGPESDPTSQSINIVPFEFTYAGLGSALFDVYDADHLTIVGGNINTYLGTVNNRDLAYVSGTKSTQNNTAIPGLNLVQFNSGIYRWTGSVAYTSGAGLFNSFVRGSNVSGDLSSDDVFSTFSVNGNDSFLASTAGLTNGGINFSSGAVINSAIVDPAHAVGHRAQQWKDGDTSVLGEANSAITSGNFTAVAWGNLSEAFGRKLVLMTRTPTQTEWQNIEADLAWEIPFKHWALPVTHPFYGVAPSGDISVPSSPSVLSYRCASGQITVYIQAGNEGNGASKITLQTADGLHSVTSASLNEDGSCVLTLTGLTDGLSSSLQIIQTNVAGSSAATSFSATTPSDTFVLSFVSQYKMEGASGASETDTVSGYNLANNGTVGSAAGLVGNGRTFSGSDRLTRTSNDALSFKNNDGGVALWFKLNANNTKQIIISTLAEGGAGADMTYFLRAENDASLTLTIGDGAGNNTFGTLMTGLVTGTWYKIVFNYFRAFKTWTFSINSSTVAIAVRGIRFGGTSSSYTQAIGGSFSQNVNGEVDGVKINGRVWSLAEMNDLSANAFDF